MVNLWIDIWGGSAKITLLDSDNTIVGDISIIDTGERAASEVIVEINRKITDLLGEWHTIESIGIAMTWLNDNGTITHCEMMKHWVGTNLGDIWWEHLHDKVHVCNDALGAAHSLIPLVQERAHNILYLTLGSGLWGTLLKSDGTIEPLEPGQSPDLFGLPGTIEIYTGKEGLKAELIGLLSGWHGVTLNEPDKLTLKDIEDVVLYGKINFWYTANLWRKEDQTKAGIIDKCTWVRDNLVRRLFMLAGTLSGTLQVYTVVLGGGPASGHPDFLVNPLKKAFTDWVASCKNGHPFYSKTPLDVMQSPHKQNSGVVGAAIYGRMMEKKKTAA